MSIKVSVLQCGALGWGALSVAGAILGASAVVVGIALLAGIVTQLAAFGVNAAR